MGYQCPIAVAPILIPFKDYEQEPDKDVVTRYSDGKTNIVFVGRIVPNKKFEDVIACFAAYKEKYDPTARLFLVGIASGDSWRGLSEVKIAVEAYCTATQIPRLFPE